MYELGAEFDGARDVSRRDGEDAAAYTIACLEDFDVNARVMQRTSSSQSCRARTDHHHHETKCTAIDD